MHTPLSHPAEKVHPDSGNAEIRWLCEELTLEVVLALTPEWEDLAQDVAEANIFQFPHFIRHSLPLLAWQRPQIITIRQAHLLIGIAILQRDVGYAKLPVPFWKSAIHAEQYLGTPLVRAGFEEEFAAGLTAWLDQAPLHCGFLQLAKIASDGPVAKAMMKLTQQAGRALMIANLHERAGIAPKARPGALADTHLSASRRRSIRRARKRLDDAGEVSIERLDKKDQLDEWIDQFLVMEDSGWKREAGSSILSCVRETALYRAMMREAFENGNLNLTRLNLNQMPIAYTLDILAPPTGFCLKSAIHPDYRKYSPGVLMEFETLKFYLGDTTLELLDSCTHPENAMLNELWPDKRKIMDLMIARSGPIYGAMFACVRAAKALLQRSFHV
jgi:CelD/BcsL family acetyltransferase involved in cellulose biosynthesis